MFCRLAFMAFLMVLIVYPAQTVETVGNVTIYMWNWLAAFDIEYAKEMAGQGIEIVNDRLQHRELQ